MNTFQSIFRVYMLACVVLTIPFSLGFWRSNVTMSGSPLFRMFKMVVATVWLFIFVTIGMWIVVLTGSYKCGKDMGESIR